MRSPVASRQNVLIHVIAIYRYLPAAVRAVVYYRTMASPVASRRNALVHVIVTYSTINKYGHMMRFPLRTSRAHQKQSHMFSHHHRGRWLERMKRLYGVKGSRTTTGTTGAANYQISECAQRERTADMISQQYDFRGLQSGQRFLMVSCHPTPGTEILPLSRSLLTALPKPHLVVNSSARARTDMQTKYQMRRVVL